MVTMPTGSNAGFVIPADAPSLGKILRPKE
jgi:hypothetical protein